MVAELFRSRDHTERTLGFFGGQVGVREPYRSVALVNQENKTNYIIMIQNNSHLLVWHRKV